MDTTNHSSATPLLQDQDEDVETSSSKDSESSDVESESNSGGDDGYKEIKLKNAPTPKPSRLASIILWCYHNPKRTSLYLLAICSVIGISLGIYFAIPRPGVRDLACTTWPEDIPSPTASSGLKASQHRTADHGSSAQPNDEKTNSTLKWTKPDGFKIVAVVFYGRRESVNVLDCYLKRNLASNGGYLDEVNFMVNTKDEKDLEWLDSLVKTSDGYKILIAPCKEKGAWKKGFACMWEALNATDTMYIKMDDDVAYMHEDAIPELVKAMSDNRNAIAIGSNIVNSKMSLTHLHADAILPYLPEKNISKRKRPVTPTWRASELPDYDGDFLDKKHLETLNDMPVPYPGHRWLPVRSPKKISKTPASHSDEYRKWPVGAQEEYSLLENIENNHLHKYMSGDPIWNPAFERYNINLMAMWGADIPPVLKDIANSGDEKAITVAIPQRLGRPFLVARRSLVAHYSFWTQIEGIEQSDLLDRFRAYANEMVCPPGVVKKPLLRTCPGF